MYLLIKIQIASNCCQTHLFLNECAFKFSLFAPAQKVAPFYEEWWFLVVVALVGLIFILLLVFILIIRGQSKKYAKKSESGELNGKLAAAETVVSFNL